MTETSLHKRGPGGPSRADALLKGAIDIHHHGYPEISFEQKTRLDDADELTIARDAGMAGIVIKSHMWPSVGRTYLLAKQVPGIQVWGSITMNPVSGGFSPMAVESAARQGARMLFFPTWGAAHDMERGGMSRHMGHLLEKAAGLKLENGLRVTDPDGRIKPEVDECLAVAAQYKLAVATGHISPRESIALAAGAKKHGIHEIFFQHPDSNSTGATRDDIREIVKLGGVVEVCALGMLPAFQRITARTMVEIIEEVGPDQTVLTTDYFFEWAPPAAETLRMTAGTFLDLGLPEETVRKMMQDTPARLLGIRR